MAISHFYSIPKAIFYLLKGDYKSMSNAGLLRQHDGARVVLVPTDGRLFSPIILLIRIILRTQRIRKILIITIIAIKKEYE